MCLKRSFWRVASLIFFCVATGPVAADHALADVPRLSEYFKETWTTREGLPHNTVNAITQTSDGYLWFATWEGVARYNGREFKVFERDETTGFTDAGIHALAVRDNGHLVLGGARGALHYYTQNQWFDLPQPNALVTAIEEDRFDNLWVATQGAGIFKVTTDSAHRLNHFNGAHATVYHVEDIPALGLLAGTAEGIWVLSPSRLEVADQTTSWGTLQATREIAHMEVRDFYYNEHEELYLATENGLYIATDEGLSAPYPGTEGITLTHILVDKEGALWLGSQDQGLFRLSQNGLEKYSIDNGLPNNRIVSIYEDRESSIWVGTNSGLVRFRTAPFKSYERADGLSDDFVRGVTLYNEGGVLIATSQGVSLLKDNRVEPFMANTVLANESFLSVEQDAQGGIWLGTISNGAFHVQGEQIRHLTQAEGLPDLDIRSIESAADGGMWFGTAMGLVHIENGVYRDFYERNGLAGDFVMAVHEDRFQTIWVGTGRGVTRITEPNPGEFQLQNFTVEELGTARYVFGFYERAESNEMWMATDRGMLRYDYETSTLGYVGKEAGLPFDKYFELIEDQDNFFWLSSNRGIVRVPYSQASAIANGENKHLTVEIFGESDGMASAQANGGAGPAAAIEPSGRIVFATSRGVAVVHPDRIDDLDDIKPPVVIEALVVDGAEVNWHQSLEFSPGTRRISFEFAGLGYVMPQRIQYRTMLEGFDDHWVERGTQAFAEYTNLKPGTYTFKVQANFPNSQEEWNEASVQFTLKPAFWQTQMFWVIVGLSLILVMFFIYRWRIAELSSAQARLKEQVREKTQELERLAMEDILTGLPNRRALDKRLKHEFNRAKRYDSNLSLAILDVDFFKQINDKHSHDIGDQALKKLANVLTGFGREVDIVGRWGGEEFVILLPDTPIDDAIAVCERLRKTVENTDLSDIVSQLNMTVSVGLASSQSVETAERLLSSADAALYEAKQTGRNRVCYRK